MSRRQHHRPAVASGAPASPADRHVPGELHLLMTRPARTPDLVLVTLENLRPDEPSYDLVEAVAELHRTFAERVRGLAQQAKNAQGDAVETANLLGRLDAYADAAADLDEEIITRFGLWDRCGRRWKTEHGAGATSAAGPQSS